VVVNLIWSKVIKITIFPSWLSQNKYRIKHLKILISIVLLILLTYNSINGLFKPNIFVQHAGLSSNKTTETFIAIPQLTIITNWVPLLSSHRLNLCNNYYQELVRTRLLVQNIAVIKKTEIKISGFQPPGFYHYFARSDVDYTG
jgi:hypothetical protein